MTKKLLAAAGFLGCILAANYVTSVYGLVPVGFGLTATAGTYFAGAAFVLRDAVQDTAGRRATFAVILVGAVLSLALSPHFTNSAFLPPGVTAKSIAIASGIAFALSETADLMIYTPLRSRGYVRAAVASNIVGALVDTYIFLTISGFGLAAWKGQLVGKLTITLAVVVVVGVTRAALRRRSVTA